MKTEGKLITLELIDTDTFIDTNSYEVVATVKCIKSGDKYLLANNNSVFFHEDLELTDAKDEQLDIPCHPDPESEMCLFKIGNEFRLCDLNMQEVETVYNKFQLDSVIELLETVYRVVKKQIELLV